MSVSRRVLWSLVVVQSLALAALTAGVLRKEGLPTLATEATAPVSNAASGRDDEQLASSGESGSRVQASDGTVRLNVEVQRASALTVEPVLAAIPPDPDAVWGEVLATRSLAEARQHLSQAAAELDQADLLLKRASQDSARLEAALADGGNVAVKSVEQARSDLALAESRRRAALASQAETRAAVRAEWGTSLLAAIERPNAGMLASVLDGTQLLVLAAGGVSSGAMVEAADRPGQRFAAQRLGPAIQSLGSAAGSTWYWRTKAGTLRVGQRVRLFQAPAPTYAGLAAARITRNGVRVPEEAVVWHAGQAWVFVQRDAERFEQRAVSLVAPLPGGWFVPRDLAPGTPVVTRGAQLLLSEASKSQIRNENGD